MKEPKTKKMKLIYKAIDYSFIKEEYIKNTYNSRWKRDSENSFMFSIKKEKDKPATNEDKLTIIENIFEIKDNSYVRDKYNQAINGSGKEEKRISVLHSSSLCSFLHFYNLRKKPIIINKVVYDEVHFEIQNQVFRNHNPSNMDIVLISNKNKKILFLEAKFSEYLLMTNHYIVNKEYKNIYEELNINNVYKIIEKKEKIMLVSKDYNKHYIAGIKQMISHYLGIKNFIYNKKSIDEKIKLREDFEVILGTILFDGWKDQDYLRNYTEEYKKIVHILNKDKNKPNNLKIVDSVLTYQEVFKNYNLNKRVKQYYRY